VGNVRIATWNVNSIRSRIDRVEAWLQLSDVDVLAIQETKARDEQFPYDRLTALGYEVAHVGFNQWNGVAIASRVGLDDVQVGFDDMPGWGDPVEPEARALGALVGGIRVWSLYVPNGRQVDDPHMVYKLDWLARLRDNAQRWLADDPEAQVALVGDWNIAPLDEDVWDMDFYLDKSHVSPGERAAFRAVVEAGYADGVRRDQTNRGAVLLRGVRCPMIGRVSMDQVAVDVSATRDVEPGDVAVLFGPGELTADDVAAVSGTVSYEVLCAVSARVGRRTSSG